MVDLILQYGMHTFNSFFLIVFFYLFRYRGRYKRNQHIPRLFIPVVSTYRYHFCIAWIMLFFSAFFLFAEQDPASHQLGFLWFAMSFGPILVARNEFEIERHKGCCRH